MTKRLLNEAFEKVDRADFVLPEYISMAYEDVPLPIGFEATISQPTTVKFMLNWLNPKPGEKILDVGSGSGWTTALLAYAVGGKGKVIGTEIVPELVKFGSENLAKYNFAQATIVQAEKIIGLPEEALFDKILVSAGAKNVPPELIDQLKVGGIMVIPVGPTPYYQTVKLIKKISKNKTTEEDYPGFAFVPLK